MRKRLIKMCEVGLDDSFERMLELVFEHSAQDFILVRENKADACIVDFDNLQAKKNWENYRKDHPHLPIIILSLNENVPEKDFFVKKPVNLNEFLKVLNRLKRVIDENKQSQQLMMDETNDTDSRPYSRPPQKEEMVLRVRSSQKTVNNLLIKSFEKQQVTTLSNYAEHTACGFEPDINPNDEKAIEKVTYDRSRRLQGLIEKALEIAKTSGCVNRLKSTMGELLIDPANQRVLSSVKEQTLHSLMLLPAKNLHIETQLLSPNQAKEYLKNSSTPFYHDCLDEFLWKTAILTSHGRVPMGTDLHSPVILSRWANFSRLMITPHALQITALWADSPYSLIETAALLQIPQRYVFSLYSAMVALNLACVTPGISPRKKTISFSNHSDKRGLFQRLLAKISF